MFRALINCHEYITIILHLYVGDFFIQIVQDSNQVQIFLSQIFNPRRACARVTVLVLSVCLCVCVCVFPILAPRAIRRTNSSISDFSAIRA